MKQQTQQNTWRLGTAGLKTNNSRLMTQRQTTRGLTLVESLVAISVLLTAIAGPITIAAQGLSIANFARQQVAAIFLAQEAVEFIRLTRDDASLNGTSWEEWLGTIVDDCEGSKQCIVDSTASGGATIQGCSGDCPVLRRHTDSGQYGYGIGGDWEDTAFTRWVRITQLADVEEVEVEAVISWQTGVIEKTVTVNGHLFNWQ